MTIHNKLLSSNLIIFISLPLSPKTKIIIEAYSIIKIAILSKYRRVGLVHQQVIPILRQIVLYTQILRLSQLRNQEVATYK